MALKEIPIKDGEQLMLPAIEMVAVVREIFDVESEKAAANADWNLRLKVLKQRLRVLDSTLREQNERGLS